MPPQLETTEALRCRALPCHHDSPGQCKSVSESQSSADPSQQSDLTPRSLYVTPIPLTREPSDLSGSYANGSGGKDGIPATIYQERSPCRGPWRQAYVASRLPPPSATTLAPRSLLGKSATVMLGCNDSIEVVNESLQDGPLNLSRLDAQEHSRIPVAVLLMDGSKQTYELLQIWIDRSSDSVGDVVQAMQRGIPDGWKPDYDGIFQVRGNHFTQLIHILRVAKYNIQPNEILIAKPFSMTAKVTISFATSVILHLTNIQVINTEEEEDKSGRRIFCPKAEDSPLLLSSAAQKRVYSPEGVLTHHHATQFLTFSPPFDSKFQTKYLPNGNTYNGSNISSISGSIFPDGLVDDLISNLRAKSREEAAAAAASERREPEESSSVQPAPSLSFPQLPGSNSSMADHDSTSRFPCDAEIIPSSTRGRRNNVSYMISQLNCCKSKDRVAALACCTPSETSEELRDGVSSNPLRVKTFNPQLLAVEEYSSWGFDVRPISGDRSRAFIRQSRSHRTNLHSSKAVAPSRSGSYSDDISATYCLGGDKSRLRLVEI